MASSGEESITTAGTSVCFVCYGNICRSPMAQALFEECVRRAGLEERISVDSAGTSAGHCGEQPHPGTLRQLERMGIRFEHAARPLLSRDSLIFPYLLALDRTVLAAMQSEGMHRAELLMSYAPDLGVRDVPDPWYTGDFEETARLVRPAVEGLLAEIRREHAW